MRRLFKKYGLLFRLALLLLTGLLINSGVTLVMSRDILLQQGAKDVVPRVADNLSSALQQNFNKVLTMSSRMAEDTFLREWLDGEEPDVQALIAHLKTSKQKDRSITHFLVSDKDQKYVDSLGTVRTINAEDYRDAWYLKTRDSKRPVELTLEADLGNDSHPVVFVSYRIVNSEHQYVGAVGLSLALNPFSSSEHSAAQSIYFVDQSGKVVLSDSNKVGNIRLQDGLKSVAGELLNDQHEPKSMTYERDGATNVISSRYIPELDWTLIVENSASELTRASWPLAYANASVSLVVTIAALVLAWFSIAYHQSRMRALASKDSMTGLMNRQSFTTTFQQTVLEMQRLKLPLSLILFDIDYLKKINESLGHATGDQIIMDIARLSKRSVRGSDLLCRWGGEQFAILLKRCDLEQAYKVAEQLRLNVQNHQFSFDDREASVTISLGVAELVENESMDALFGRVDEAVYLAKSEGRNRAEISYFVES
jgi:diguanylate cyclase (GGDEF)-like protein